VETAGHPCVAISASPRALLFCDDRRPAVLVTDLVMPDLDGRDLARWFKARYPTLPIVLVTGEAIDPPTMRMLEGTFSAVLSKPIAIERFLCLLDGLMRRGIDSDAS
jgi:CheY-like chemotaxis protein